MRRRSASAGLVLRAGDLARLAEAGVLAATERVELIGGDVVWLEPIEAQHDGIVARLRRRLDGAPGLTAAVDARLRLGEDTEVHPDVCLVAGRGDRADRMLEADEIVLVAEVSDASFAYDLETKLPLYAAAGVPELWIVHVEAGIVRTFGEPEWGTYRRIGGALAGERVAPVGAPGLDVAVDELFASAG